MAVATGCGAQTVRMEPPLPDAAAEERCAALVADLPETLMDADRVGVRPESELTAAWGEPAIGLRCGVVRPSSLAPDSQLIEVNGVPWLSEPADAPTVFTAVGHEAYVELLLPPSYGPPAPALTTIGDLVSEHLTPLPDGGL
ncbi:DUF3515 domain-containing protein [Nocardiopsis sp. N85]|uniref:DUF3515 domain-containing protein n=1 Tax=Nocardiopsis sp. N85 TaxID=3029400 RepID=UPI00237F383E|nr:DUF3515 domain-containing protein [Nocardiopsis sp. N85]MDE3721626.1 DUF3515 domain-containing protein [Nocardiopsis sp. N85]